MELLKILYNKAQRAYDCKAIHSICFADERNATAAFHSAFVCCANAFRILKILLKLRRIKKRKQRTQSAHKVFDFYKQ